MANGVTVLTRTAPQDHAPSVVFAVAAALAVLAGVASLLRGGHDLHSAAEAAPNATAPRSAHRM
jgi:hypothetical protein